MDYCQEVGCVIPDVDPQITSISTITFTELVGENTGNEFCDYDLLDDLDLGDKTVKNVFIKHGEWIDGIRFSVGSSEVSSFSAPRGDITISIDNPSFTVPSSSFINQVELTYGDSKIRSIRFMTQEQGKSSLFGNALKEHEYRLIKLNGKLIGIYGTQSQDATKTSIIKSIGFIVSKASFIIPPAIKCPDGWLSYGLYCYSWVKEMVNFDQARDGCKKRSSSLVVIRSLDQLKFILTEITSKETNFWVIY